ncbi:hypothetical protein G7054_g1534 [Neopestalotiopsis clavispora]|nr:hypothetical protein G7054_g1534 [Neopestalotiopsis clavispora]
MAARSERLLPIVVDEIAASDPGRVFFSVMKTKDPKDGFQDINAKEFARAVNRAAWYLEQSLGPAAAEFPTIAYMGPQDLVYGILVLACIKTGYKLFLPSPRNTLEAHLHLLSELDCHTFLTPPAFPLPIVKQILGQRSMHALEIPQLQHWIKDEPVEEYVYTKTFAEAYQDPFVALHTSGSTGIPKPVIQTHGTVTTLDAFTELTSLGHSPVYPAMCKGSRLYMVFPLFHCGGILMLLGSIYCGYTSVLGSYPPSPDIVNGVHVYGNVQQCIIPSMMLVDLANVPEYLENLSRLDQVSYGGGPLPQATGDLVSKKTRLMNCLGTTECGILPLQLCDAEDWAYMKVCPALGHEYRPVSGDLYEQVIVRDPKLERYQGVFATFPQLQEWYMKDMYSKHPTKENVWLYRGRTDDIIVYSTGEKLNPLSMEDVITSNSIVQATLIAGFGRFQSSLLVEVAKPPTNDTERASLLEQIWPSVKAANNISPSHGRIHKDMILFTSADKPMLRAGKGTVQRKLTLELYSEELNALYAANEKSGLESNGIGSKKWSAAGSNGDGIDSQGYVRSILADSTEIDIQSISPDADLFELGLDSLQVTLIVRKVNAFLSGHGQSPILSARMVYSNPTVAALTAVVVALAKGEEVVKHEANNSAEETMRKLYDQYSRNLPATLKHQDHAVAPSAGETVLLTGSTGSLGAYVLHSLSRDKRVSRIFCLNRGPNSHARQSKSLSAKGLPPPLDDKVVLLDADLSREDFGLPAQTYQTILDQVTTIIHNAWQVDFNLSLGSFSTQIGTVRRLIDFSAASNMGAKIVFISSVGTVTGWPAIAASKGLKVNDVPEEIFEDWSLPEPTGYGQSKYVSERLLDTAARESNIRSIICRVGQIAGPTTADGVWPKQEWLPSLIASSKHMGVLPASLGALETVDWIPVDVLGRVIVELALPAQKDEVTPSSKSRGSLVYHVANPRLTTWAELLRTVVEQYRGTLGNAVEVVPLPEWVEALRKSNSEMETADRAHVPATKILEFFEGLVNRLSDPILLDVKGAVAFSPTLAQLGQIDDTLMKNWMNQWSF